MTSPAGILRAFPCTFAPGARFVTASAALRGVNSLHGPAASFRYRPPRCDGFEAEYRHTGTGKIREVLRGAMVLKDAWA